MNLEITLLGVLFLGGFVGFVLALALSFSEKLSYKAVAAVLGAALGGAPLAFMGGLAYERWMYPIGLVLGIISIRIFAARVEFSRYLETIRNRKLTFAQKVQMALAAFDMVAIAFIIVIVIACTAFFAR